MTTCVQADAAGNLSLMTPQPADLTTCAYVLAAPAELASPFNLSIADAEFIGGGVLGVWALAWAFRRVGDFFTWSNEDEPV